MTDKTALVGTYCNILDYIEKVDSELRRLFAKLCIDASISRSKGRHGTTFIYPDDSNSPFRKKLRTLAASEKPEDGQLAADMINNLIIRDVFKRGSDWTDKSAFLANCLFPSQVVPVKSGSSDTVTFTNGSTATLDKTFEDKLRPHSKDKLAVWKLKGDPYEITTDKPAPAFAKREKSAATKLGGYQPGNLVNNLRYRIGIMMENWFAIYCTSGQDKSVLSSPYIQATASLIRYLHTNNKQILFDKVLPLISFDHIDFYLIVEPHRDANEYLIGDDIIAGWWQSFRIHEPAYNYTEYIAQLFKEAPSIYVDGPIPEVYRDRVNLITKVIRKERETVRTMLKPGNYTTVMKQYYDQLSNSNSIGGVSPVYPPGLADYYSRNPGMKLIQDELRYVSFGLFKKVLTQYNPDSYNQLVDTIGEYLHVVNGSPGRFKLFNENIAKNPLHNDKIYEVIHFIYTTMFCFVPLTHEETIQMPSKTKCRPLEQSETTYHMLWSIVHQIHKESQQQRIITGKQNVDKIMTLINDMNNVDLKTLSDKIMGMLQGR